MAKNINNLDKTSGSNHTHSNYATTTQLTTTNNNIGTLSSLKTSAKGSLVAAINELFQNANNGKNLIANAIGEPLSSNDTFSAMSDDINSLLNTFKTNMTNYGVDVEESDKFKQLIDRIATLANNEGKGIQFASGTIDDSVYKYIYQDNAKTNLAIPFEKDLGFTPNILFVHCTQFSSSAGYATNDAILSNYQSINVMGLTSVTNLTLKITNITSSSFSIDIESFTNNSAYGVSSIKFVGGSYYAIGEKTTTQISNKTDGFNIEVASSLPKVVIQDRICIVEPNDNVNVYMGYESRTNAVSAYPFNTNEIYVYMTNETSQNTHTINLNRGNVKFKYNIGGAFKYNGSSLALCEQVYKGDNNQWVKLWDQFNVFSGGEYYNNMSFQSTNSNKLYTRIVNGKIEVYMDTSKSDSSSVYSLYSPVINLSNFDKLYITISDVSYGSMGYNNTSQEVLRFGVASGDPASSHPDSFAKYKTITQSTLSTMNTNSSQTLTLIIDVSTLSGNHFIKINKKTAFYMTGSFRISDIYFTML